MSLITSNDDILSDNTKIEYCKQCKNCIHWDKDGSPFGNQYDKACCDMFPYPERKPDFVINNQDECEFKEEK